MTDAKEPEVIAEIRAAVETEAALPLRRLRAATWLTRFKQYREILAAYDTLTRERDAAVKRRREIDDEAFDYAEQIETLKTQLAAALVLLKSVPSELNAAFSAGAEERENGSDRRQEKQMEKVYAMRKAITAALSEATP
jgi:hypothetical protein